MTPELQTVIDRLELVERQNRSAKLWAVVATVIALAAVAVPFVLSRPESRSSARYSVVEANRFLLRDLGGKVCGGMEVDGQGTIKLVLGGGYGQTGAAFLEVQQNGASHMTLRGPDGRVRASVLGTRTPSLTLSPQGERSSAALMTLEDGSGSLFLTNSEGRIRFKAP